MFEIRNRHLLRKLFRLVWPDTEAPPDLQESNFKGVSDRKAIVTTVGYLYSSDKEVQQTVRTTLGELFLRVTPKDWVEAVPRLGRRMELAKDRSCRSAGVSWPQ